MVKHTLTSQAPPFLPLKHNSQVSKRATLTRLDARFVQTPGHPQMLTSQCEIIEGRTVLIVHKEDENYSPKIVLACNYL